MAKIRLTNLKPPCGYNLPGIAEVKALDFDDLLGLRFSGDDLYKNCLITGIARAGEFSEIEAPEGAKYSSTYANKIYTHTLETFVADLSASVLASTHVGTRRRVVVLFKNKLGKYFLFGSDAGATFGPTIQTADALGVLITLSASSVFPLFEVDPAALTPLLVSEFRVDFLTNAYCEIK